MINANDLARKRSRPSAGVVHAVDGVSFAARDGEITGLLGPNGAGKTTTLRMLYTLMTPDQRQRAASTASMPRATPKRCVARSACCRMRAACTSA